MPTPSASPATTSPAMTDESLELSFEGKSVKMPVIRGTEDETAIDISRLRSDTGLITMDPGYGNTGSCSSAITFIDGEKGILRYRGYSIEELAAKSTFLEVAYLLIHGELPTAAQASAFTGAITRHTAVGADFRRFFDALPRDAHPMPVCASAVSALATYAAERGDPADTEDSMVRLIAKMPSIAACSFRHSRGETYVAPRDDLDYAGNFLHMMFGADGAPDVNPVVAKALDLLLILHADHEQNCSTSTVRMVGSSKAPLYASVSAGISALWGPLHGGANQKVIEMLDEIAADGGDVSKFVERAKDKTSGKRLMGFGHRVYKSFDPRASILKQACSDVLDSVGGGSGETARLLDIAMQLEQVALSDEYFIGHKLYPNVDFYSGVIYEALDIPVNMFTVMFAIGRAPGWISQWHEMCNDPSFRIGRPRQIYTGHALRSYVPMDQRG